MDTDSRLYKIFKHSEFSNPNIQLPGASVVQRTTTFSEAILLMSWLKTHLRKNSE